MKDRDEQRQQQKKSRKEKRKGRLFCFKSGWADEVQHTVSGKSISRNTQKEGKKRKRNPTIWLVRFERNRWFKRFLIIAVVITRERALLSLLCNVQESSRNKNFFSLPPPIESPSLLFFYPSLIITGRTRTDQLRVQFTQSVQSSHRAAMDFRISRR